LNVVLNRKSKREMEGGRKEERGREEGEGQKERREGKGGKERRRGDREVHTLFASNKIGTFGSGDILS
jgi:hypothetical protein